MPNDIILKFKPEGNRALVRAIEELQIATEKYGGTIPRVNKSAKKLTAQLKAQNLSWKKLGVSSKTLQQAYRGNATAIERMRVAMIKTTKAGNGMLHSQRLLQGSFATFRSHLLLVTFGMGLAAKSIGSWIKVASEAEETQNKLNVVFGPQAQVVNQWATALGQSVGRAEKDIKSMLSSLQDTFVPMGISREVATDYSTSLVKLALDVASFQNAQDEDVVKAFQSALVGNHETVKKYGITINETTLKQEAWRSGLIDTDRPLTNQEKVTARLNLLFKGSKDAIGDLERTQKSYANQVKALSAEFTNLKQVMGETLIPMARTLVQLASHFAKTETIKGYASAVGIAAVALGIYHQKAVKAAVSTALLGKTIKKTGVGLLVILLGEVITKFLNAEDATEAYNDILKETENSMRGLRLEFEKDQAGMARTITLQRVVLMAYNEEHILRSKLLGVQKDITNAKSLDGSIEIERQTALKVLKEQEERQLITTQEFREKSANTNAEFDAKEMENQQAWMSALEKEFRIQQQLANIEEARTKSIGRVFKALGKVAGAQGEHARTAAQLAKAGAIIDMFAGANKAFKQGGVFGFATGAAILLEGWANIAAIDAQLAQMNTSTTTPLFQEGGYVGGRRHSQGGTLIEAEQGEFVMSRNAVESIGIEALNRMNLEGGGGGVNITVTGNVLTQDYVEGELAESIKEALRRGSDFGIS